MNSVKVKSQPCPRGTRAVCDRFELLLLLEQPV
jgi:hypothetical protein